MRLQLQIYANPEPLLFPLTPFLYLQMESMNPKTSAANIKSGLLALSRSEKDSESAADESEGEPAVGILYMLKRALARALHSVLCLRFLLPRRF